MHPPRRQLALNFFAKHGRQLIAHQSVKYAARLLRVHEVHIDFSGFFDSLVHRALGNLVEHYAAVIVVKPQSVHQMPGNGFSLPVGVGCEINLLGFFGQARKPSDYILLFGINHVFGLEIVFYVYADCLFRQIAHVSARCVHNIIPAKIFFYRFSFRGRFHDD